MNEKGVDSSKSEVLKEESKEEVQKESKEEESTRKRKLGTRKKMKSRKEAEDLEEIIIMWVIRSNGQKRYFSTLMRVLSIFDREDLNVVYQLVMDRFQDEIPEGFDRNVELKFRIGIERLVHGLELIRFIKKLLGELEPEE
ncbi:hypothetical protein Tco_1500250 [Tanacetum coccineum]